MLAWHALRGRQAQATMMRPELIPPVRPPLGMQCYHIDWISTWSERAPTTVFSPNWACMKGFLIVCRETPSGCSTTGFPQMVWPVPLVSQCGCPSPWPQVLHPWIPQTIALALEVSFGVPMGRLKCHIEAYGRDP